MRFFADWFWSYLASRVASILLVLALCGCSASHLVGVHTEHYRDTAAHAGDSQLLLNILRAKDNLPIHFYDLSIIRGSIQLAAGTGGSIPVAQNGSATPALLSPLASVQTAPTFDVGTSDTQDFTRGILSPLDPRVVKALFDQGVNPRIMMLLFFSAYHTPSGKTLLNTMACDPSTIGHRPEEGCLLQIYAYLHEIEELLRRANRVAGMPDHFETKVRANIFNSLRPLGQPIGGSTLGNLTELRQIDPMQYRLINNRLYSVLPELRLAICYEHYGSLSSLFREQYPDAACNQKEVVLSESQARRSVGLTIRSTYDIIQFLGQVLRFQQEERNLGRDRCLTLTSGKRSCGVGEVLFQVDAPVGTPIISTHYDGRSYALSDRNCEKIYQQPFYQRQGQPLCDYSVQVLAILELLINENRAAKDIVATPSVRAVQ